LNVALSERATEVDGYVYHTTCFTCSACHATISGTFLVIDGQARCDRCAQQNRCETCQRPLDGAVVAQADGKRVHAACAGVTSCGKCQRALLAGAIVSAGPAKYHAACFVCSACSSSLTEYVLLDGQFYCKTCGNNRRLPNCSVCRTQISVNLVLSIESIV
jgi:hypothetical protein